MAAKFKILSAGGDSKGLNIFKSSAYKDHEKAPMAQAFWRIRWACGIWIACAVAFGLSFAVEYIWRMGWSPATWQWCKIYFTHMLTSGGLSVMAEIPAWAMRTAMHTDMPCLTPLLPILTYYFLADTTLTKEFNPHGKDKFDAASSNKATEEEIKKMGLLSGFMMV